MNECRTLWSRYQLAMENRDRAESDAEQAAWWAEANEWLGRYFDAVDRQLECDLEKSSECRPELVQLVVPRPMLLRPSERGIR